MTKGGTTLIQDLGLNFKNIKFEDQIFNIKLADAMAMTKGGTTLI